MYDIDGVLPVDAVTSVQPGTNLLVVGAPMVGKHELALELLTKGFDDGDGVLCVTTNDSVAGLTDSLSQRGASFDPDRIGIVSCSGQESSGGPSDVATEFVSSPNDLTGISIGTVKILKSFSNRNISSIRHGILSVSTLQQYLDTRTVFKFLHIYTSRVRDTDGLGIFTLHSSTRDSEVVNTLSSEFDGVIELRETADDVREVRLTGVPAAPRTWCTY